MSKSLKNPQSHGLCRTCGHELHETFADLGMSPLSNSFLSARELNRMERYYPLHAYTCSNCLHVQLETFESPEAIFSDYAYFSSYSDSWLAHAKAYCEKMIDRFDLNAKSRVVEIASNDGYLLQYFQKHQIGVLGVEPAQNVARIAVENGIPTETRFFGADTANDLRTQGKTADLICANNVLAHVPDVHDFLEGFRILLKSGGVATFEFPHLQELMRHNEFDTIYHEHFSYFSLYVVKRLLSAHGLTIFDVEKLSTHGGSLRVYARHEPDRTKPVLESVSELLEEERNSGLHDAATYLAFRSIPAKIKADLMHFLIECFQKNRQVVAYGAPAKGNTLLNYCGATREFLPYTVDRSPHKQGLFLPGTHIPIEAPEKIAETKPAYVLILPWNLRHEISSQMAQIRAWGGQFVVAIPALEVF